MRGRFGDRRWWWRCSATLGLTLTVLGCGSAQNSIVDAYAGRSGTLQEIDEDRRKLLPSGAVVWTSFDAQALFASPFGPELLRLVQRRIPVPVGSGFEPQRDLLRVDLGIYSMQGADFVGVAEGTFSQEGLHGAADRGAASALGVPFAKTRYAELDVFVAQDLGFTVLTPSTLLFGNQMGVRRALDRLREGRLKRELPSWFEAQLEHKDVPFVLGMDLAKNPVSAASREKLPFLLGLKNAGVIANFQAPGMHLAGTLGYESDAAAQEGARNLMRINELVQSYSWVMALLGMGQPIQRLETQADGKHSKFVAALDGQVVGQLLGRVDSLLPKWGAPPAAQGP